MVPTISAARSGKTSDWFSAILGDSQYVRKGAEAYFNDEKSVLLAFESKDAQKSFVAAIAEITGTSFSSIKYPYIQTAY